MYKRQAQTTTEPDVDWEEIVAAVAEQLIGMREMLAEYFSLEISEQGEVMALPLLLRGYTPPMAKLPRFLLRLGPHVDWEDEQSCFHSFLRELASWYVPEPLPALPTKEAAATKEAGAKEAGEKDGEESGTGNEMLAAQHELLERQLEHVFFPAFKSRLLATKGMLKGVVEVANLKGLYRVFERC